MKISAYGFFFVNTDDVEVSIAIEKVKELSDTKKTVFTQTHNAHVEMVCFDIATQKFDNMKAFNEAFENTLDDIAIFIEPRVLVLRDSVTDHRAVYLNGLLQKTASYDSYEARMAEGWTSLVDKDPEKNVWMEVLDEKTSLVYPSSLKFVSLNNYGNESVWLDTNDNFVVIKGYVFWRRV